MKSIIYICTNLRGEQSAKPSCGRRDSEKLFQTFKEDLEKSGGAEKYDIASSGCLGACEDGITILFFEEQIFYGNVQIVDIPEIIDSHILNDKPVERLLIKRLMMRRALNGTST
jgi:(2Fe-2S) ferredoxin